MGRAPERANHKQSKRQKFRTHFDVSRLNRLRKKLSFIHTTPLESCVMVLMTTEIQELKRLYSKAAASEEASVRSYVEPLSDAERRWRTFQIL